MHIRTAKDSECVLRTKQYRQHHTKNELVTLAPNRYQIKGTDLSDISKKRTGTKGPYSCFTGYLKNNLK